MKNCTLFEFTGSKFQSTFAANQNLFPYLTGRLAKSIGCFFLLVGILANQQAFAQEFPAQCVSQDLLIVDAELVFEDPCLNCEEGEILYPTLMLGIDNKTGSFRPTFAFWGTLVISDAEGNEIGRTTLSRCNDQDGLPANTVTYIPFGEISYKCGEGMKLVDLHLAWTDASQGGKNACDLDPATINPKCGTLTEIEVRPPLFASVLDKDDVVCKGEDNGTIDLYVNGGDQPYTFDWADLAGTNDPQDRTDLAPGIYSVTVTDVNGCFREINSIEIDEPEEVVEVSATEADISCYNEADGSITVTAIGYDRLELWKEGTEVTDAVFVDGQYTGLAPGTYVVKAFADGSNGEEDACTDESEAVVIEEPGDLVLSLEADEILCYGGTTSIALAVVGGTPPYSYDWSDLPGEDDPEDRADIAAGEYAVTVTDDNGCTVTGNITIDEPAVLAAVVNPVDVTCFEGADGSINVSAPTGGSGNYEFSLDGVAWQSEPLFDDLAAGFYDVYIRDADAVDCWILIEEDLEIDEPAVLAAVVDSDDVTCFEGADGSITVSAPSGGSGAYEYSVDGTTWFADAVFNNLSAGFYDVYIRDAAAIHCVILLQEDLEIDEPAILGATVTSEDINCYSGSGSIAVSAPTGGSGAYEYSINGTTWLADPIFTGLSAGYYDVYIRDAAATGCVILLQEDLEIEAPEILAATVTSVDVSCFGGSDGSIAVSNPTGGSGTYQFSIDGTTWQDELVFGGLEAGFYDVYIRDAAATDCVITIDNDLEINEPAILAAVVTSVDVTCFDGSDGSITVSNPTGGSGTYQFSIDGTTWQNELVFDNLFAGVYDVYIRDAQFTECYIQLDSQIIEQPEVLHAHFGSSDVTCHGYADGTITISNPTGGSGNYEYSINGGTSWQSESTFTGLAPGEYFISVRDADSQSCIVDQGSVYIYQPIELVASVETITNATCSGSANGAIDIGVTGGTAPYSYLWSTGTVTEDLEGISAGLYSVEITDANGCTVELTAIEVEDPSDLVAEVEETNNVTCYGISDGSVDISVAGGTAPYTFAWSNAAESEDLQAVAAGTYSVTITDANGCSVTLSGIVVGQPAILEADVDLVTAVSCYGLSDGSVDISVAGGTAPYTFVWSNAAETEDLEAVAAGTYSVTITDANGCSVTLKGIVVGQPAILEADVDSVTAVSCYGLSDGSVDISVAGGTAPYTFVWSNAAETEDLDAVAAGTYSVVITDANGCSVTQGGIVVGQPVLLEADIVSVTDATCSGSANGAIDISVEGGTAPYVFVWSTGAVTEDLDGLTAGIYSVEVTDANGCTVELTDIEVEDPSDLVAVVVNTKDVSCHGSADGLVNISVEGGTAPYTFTWSNGSEAQDLDGVGAGTYSVTVTDANGCSATLSGIVIGQPSELMVDVTVQNITCYGNADGSITLTISGGTPPYTSEWGDADENGVIVLENLSAGFYSVVVSDANQCGLAIDEIEVTQPEPVNIPDYQVSQADCLGGNGGLVFVNPGEDLYYSIDGGDFMLYTGEISLAVDTYNFRVRYEEDGCISEEFDVSINRPGEVNVDLFAEVVQPDCETLLGTILLRNADLLNNELSFTVTHVGTNTEYYSGVDYPVGGFTGLPVGSYYIEAATANGCESGNTTAQLVEPDCQEFTGCTLGYWKNHTDRWCDEYQTCTLYSDVFGTEENPVPDELEGLTLLQVLNLGGGGIYNLGRQSVAALLNACSEEVNYELETTADVIDYVNSNFENAGSAGAYLDLLNNAGCTMGGSMATTAPSEGCEDEADSGNGNNGNYGNDAKGNDEKSKVESSVSAYPVPFKETINLQYDIEYSSDVVIEVYDMRGTHLRTYSDKKVGKEKVTTLNVDFALKANQMYVLKIKTDRETFVKQIISSRD